MQPHLIKSTADTSLALLRLHGRGSPEAFLLAWVAWEGLKIRILVVGLATKGWRVQDVYDVLSAQRVHDHRHVRHIFKQLFGSFPESTPGLGEAWRGIEAFRGVRNRYVHGTRGADPLRLESATRSITERVFDTAWLEDLSVRVDGEKRQLGDPYRRMIGRRAGHKSKDSLTDLIREARPSR